MRLYEINQAMTEIADKLDFDFESGEVGENFDEELYQMFLSLSEDRQERLQYLAKITLNTKADAESLKAEKSRLDRRMKIKNRQYRTLLDILDRECGGEKTDLGVATLSYRNTKSTEIKDPSELLKWIISEKKYGLLNVKDDFFRKSDIKKLIDDGVDVEGAEIVTNKSYSLR